MLYFNVRNFKAVNELFGIDNGDKVLRMIHKHLKESRLKPCITARVEADQFTCLIRKENLDLEVLSGLCEWNFAHDGKMMNILCGCGIFYVEDKPMSINGMIDRAKIAKRYIKDEYVKPYNIYDTTMKSHYINRAELTGELKNGLAQEQFKVYYQPVIDAKTEKNCICGSTDPLDPSTERLCITGSIHPGTGRKRSYLRTGFLRDKESICI